MKTKLFYGWVVVAVTVLAVLIGAGVRSAPGVFLRPMVMDTGFNLPAISFAVSIGLVFYGLAAPFSGYFMDRFGPKKVTLAGLVTLALSMMMSARLASQLELNLFWGALSGAATGMVGGVLGAAVANRWFIQKRSTVVGIFGASTSAGQLIFIPLLSLLVDQIGWRASAVVMGALALLVAIPVMALMKDQPGDAGLRPFGAKSSDPISAARPKADDGVMGRALRSGQFWLLAGTFFVCGATSNGIIGTHFIAHTADFSIPTATAAGMLSLLGMMNFVGTLVSGHLTDRHDPRKLLFIYYGFRGLSLLALPFLSDLLGLAGFAVLFGLDYIATVPPTTALVADTFGRKNVGTVYGWVFCAHQIGAAMAASLGGIVRQNFGAYAPAFLGAGVLAVLAALLSLKMSRGQLAVAG